MIYSKGSKLHFIIGDTKYTYLVSEASLAQNIREASYSRNTIHTTNIVDYSFPDTVGPASVDLTMHLGRNEKQLFDFIGLRPSIVNGVIKGYYADPTYVQDLSTAPNIYLESNGGVYEVTQVVSTTCSFALGPKTVAAVKISAQGSKLTQVSSVPLTPNTITQSSSTFYSSSLQVLGFERLSSVTLELTRDLAWLGYKGIHEIGQLVYPSRPSISRLSLSGTIVVYTTAENPIRLYDSNTRIVIEDSEYQIELASCMVSTRLNTGGDVHTTMVDYKLNPNNIN